MDGAVASALLSEVTFGVHRGTERDANKTGLVEEMGYFVFHRKIC